MATPSRQNKRILDMLTEILERLERLENGNAPTQTAKKPAAKKAAK